MICPKCHRPEATEQTDSDDERCHAFTGIPDSMSRCTIAALTAERDELLVIVRLSAVAHPFVGSKMSDPCIRVGEGECQHDRANNELSAALVAWMKSESSETL